ncbi:MAG: UbiA family prenyltransferase [Planctomycetes bacterium]|nr:UbiA family prenyltransferase [Planctomycetota bacterium]
MAEDQENLDSQPQQTEPANSPLKKAILTWHGRLVRVFQGRPAPGVAEKMTNATTGTVVEHTGKMPVPLLQQPAKPGRIVSWCRLLRLPNLFTVPGDPMAGFFLALIGVQVLPENLEIKLAAAVTISLLMYCAGLLFNDLFDLKEDRRDRPNRPLPSGAVKPMTVAIVATLLLLLALGFAWLIGSMTFYVSLALAACILIYDGFAKRIPGIGPFIMGACRGLSVLVGASVIVYGIYPIAFAGVITLYIAAVTSIAKNETSGQSVGIKRFGPGIVLLLPLLAPLFDLSGLSYIYFIVTTWFFIAIMTTITKEKNKGFPAFLERFGPAAVILLMPLLLLFLQENKDTTIYDLVRMALGFAWYNFTLGLPIWCVIRTFLIAGSLKDPHSDVARQIGVLIRLLIPIQFTVTVITGYLYNFTHMSFEANLFGILFIECLIILLICWPMAYFVGKKFYSS